MIDLLKDGSAWLGQQMKAFAAQSVTYAGNGWQLRCVSAVIGRTTFNVDDGNGVVVTLESRDYMVATADLIVDGVTMEPTIGDTITEGSVIYTVMDFGTEPAWRFSDPYRQTYRIHTKQTSKT
jgi:hypothetical protein